MTADDTPAVLIADDQADVIEALRLLFKNEGIETHSVNSPAAVLHALERRDFDALLFDMNYTRDTTSGREGLPSTRRSPEARASGSCCRARSPKRTAGRSRWRIAPIVPGAWRC